MDAPVERARKTGGGIKVAALLFTLYGFVQLCSFLFLFWQTGRAAGWLYYLFHICAACLLAWGIRRRYGSFLWLAVIFCGWSVYYSGEDFINYLSRMAGRNVVADIVGGLVAVRMLLLIAAVICLVRAQLAGEFPKPPQG